MFHFIKSLEKEVYVAAVLIMVIIGLTTEGFGGGGRSAMTAMAETTEVLPAEEEEVRDSSDGTGEADLQEAGRDSSERTEEAGLQEAGRNVSDGTEEADLQEAGRDVSDEKDEADSHKTEEGNTQDSGENVFQNEDTVSIEYGQQVVGYLLAKDIKQQNEAKTASSPGEPEEETEDDPPINQQDYQVLLKIVEAEAGICDAKGKILVANVILNRVKSDEFPNSVTDVVYQPSQFSPVSDGSINTCQVSSATVESVDRALSGEDYSQGALFFMNRAASHSGAVRWFDGRLTYLFAYQGHEFFK